MSILVDAAAPYGEQVFVDFRGQRVLFTIVQDRFQSPGARKTRDTRANHRTAQIRVDQEGLGTGSRE